MPNTTVKHIPSPLEAWAGLWTVKFTRGPLWVELVVAKETTLTEWRVLARQVCEQLRAMEKHLADRA